MASLRLPPRDPQAEALYWLDLAKRVLGQEIAPDVARRALELGYPAAVIVTLGGATSKSEILKN